MSKRPTNKVGAAGLGGALATIVVAVLNINDPELAAAIATISAFVAGYLVPDA